MGPGQEQPISDVLCPMTSPHLAMKGAISTHILTVNQTRAVNQTRDQAQRQQRWESTHDHMTFGDIQLGREDGNGRDFANLGSTLFQGRLLPG